MILLDEEIPLYRDVKCHANCCYSRVNWSPGSHHKITESFCNEPDQTSLKHSSDGSIVTPKTLRMGWPHHPSIPNIQEYRASPSSSSNLSTYNSSKNNLSMPSSSSNHRTLPKESTKALRQNTQFETLPIKGHGFETPILSSSTIDYVLYSENTPQRLESLSEKSFNNKGITNGNSVYIK